MQTLDDAIMELLKRSQISAEDAYTNAVEKPKFLGYLKKPPSDFTEV
jgi:twitching motility protein PilT